MFSNLKSEKERPYSFNLDIGIAKDLCVCVSVGDEGAWVL